MNKSPTEPNRVLSDFAHDARERGIHSSQIYRERIGAGELTPDDEPTEVFLPVDPDAKAETFGLMFIGFALCFISGAVVGGCLLAAYWTRFVER